MTKFRTIGVMLLMAACLSSYAGLLTIFGPRRKPETLIVTSNYKSPRLLADLIQAESRQPYLLLPASTATGKQIIFCPPKKGQALQIREDRVNEFVRWLAPKRILILGDRRFVDDSFVERLDKTIPVIRIESTNWARVADEVTWMMGLSNLKNDFRRLQQDLLDQGGVYRPISRPRQPQPTTKPDQSVTPANEAAAPESAPAEAAPSEATPVETAPVETAPAAETVPAEVAPVTAPTDTAPVATPPTEAVPADAPADTMPADPVL
ncbi:MAG: hypothetical protein MJ025_02255 [Victivallaceae bacterium]|nr:hypothetical protein [Victivallaceae bacterium]